MNSKNKCEKRNSINGVTDKRTPRLDRPRFDEDVIYLARIWLG
jgi:hypothetical protein